MSYSPARLEPQLQNDNAMKPEVQAIDESATPSWFAAPSEKVDPENLMERYRERMANEQAQQHTQDQELEEYRRKLDEKFNTAKRLYDPPIATVARREPVRVIGPVEVTQRVKRPTLPRGTLQDIGARYARDSAPAAIAPKRAARPASPISTYATYAAIAILIGGGAGYGFANRQAMLGFGQDSLSRVRALVAGTSKPASTLQANAGMVANAPAAAANSTTITKKTIPMASLTVNDVTGTLNNMIPLTLSATPSDAAQPVDLVISGLPSSAYLTAGQQNSDGNWVVKGPDVANLRMVVAQSDTPKLDLQVAAIEPASGALAAPAQKLKVELSDVQITPTSAPPEGQTSNIQVKPADATVAVAGPTPSAVPPPISAAPAPGADLVAHADNLMTQGDIVSARQIYLQAASQGNAKAAYGVARSYDPKVFAELKIEGLQPDAAKASDWYKKAASAGVTSTQ